MDLVNAVRPSIIKVIGVGGGGCNAVNYMQKHGISGVDFLVCNTDTQSLEASPVMNKIQLGRNQTDGLGVGNSPERGKSAAEESLEDIKTIFDKNTKMVFVTAGMGGGTGTGAAPVIASAASEMGVLTVGIVTIPFSFEGRKRKLQAENGINELKQHVDSLLIICNDKLRELHGNLKMSEAFSKADDVLLTAAKGIAEIITVTGYVNVDFEDVKTVMKNSGVAIMGIGTAEGENRAIKAAEMALSSPLLNDNNIKKANNVLLYIISGSDEIKLDELTEITDFIQDEAGPDAGIIWGNGTDENLGKKISVILVAAGFESSANIESSRINKKTKTIHQLDGTSKKEEKPYDVFSLNVNKESEQKSIALKTDNTKKNDDTHKVKYKLFEDELPQTENKNQSDTETTNSSKDNNEEFILFLKKDEEKNNEESKINDISVKTQNERILKLREMSIKFKSKEGLNELESTPAYARKGIEISSSSPSEETEVSNSSLSDSDSPQIKPNNSFLHDNVD